jgi:DinB superfamily
VREILQGISATGAQARPLPNGHSIWELVLHVEAWCKFAHGAVHGKVIPAWPFEQTEMDWPPVGEPSEKAWQSAMSSFFANHQRLVEAINTFGDDRLETTVPGRTYDFYRLFQGSTQHAIYHAGQIALLKKIL